jgi:agmatinase
MEQPLSVAFGGPEVQTCHPEKAGIIVLPLCYEHAPSYGTGSRNGPLHVLVASEQLEIMDEEVLVDWSKPGIHTMNPVFPAGDPEDAVLEMKDAVATALSHNVFVLVLGGDHAISIGAIWAAADKFPDIGVLQIDAHLDLRDQWNGSRFNHACVMRRVIEDIGLAVIQVGIRSFSPEEIDYVKKNRLQPFYAHDIAQQDSGWVEKVIEGLQDRVYVTIDLDGLDPSVIPGTGTPEPGGLLYRQVVELIKAIGQSGKKVVAADINELAKIPGSQVSEFTAAKLATKLFVHCA